MRAHQRLHVVAFDYGVKRNILRMLADRGCRMTVVPAQTSRRRSARARAGWRVPLERTRRSGALRLRHRGDPRARRRRHADVRHLPRPPVAGPRERRAHHEDEVRPSRRESSGAGSRNGPRVHHQPESWLRGRRERPAVDAQGHASFAVRRLAAGHRAHRPSRPSASRDIRKRARARRTWARMFDRFVHLMLRRLQQKLRARSPATSRRTRPPKARRQLHAKTYRHQKHPDHWRRPDHHRPGVRVRLFRSAGLQGAAGKRATASSS